MLNSGQNQPFACDPEIRQMTLKNNRHLFYAISNFVHHFIAISVFKLELQSENAQFGWKSTFFFCPIWPWKIIGHLFYATSSFVHHLSQQWIQIGVTVWKCPIWVKIEDFLCHMTLKFTGWPWKTIGHISYATSSCEFKLELGSANR